LIRLGLSRRRLLEWTSSARAGRNLAQSPLEFFSLLKVGPWMGLGLLATLAVVQPPAWPLGAAFALGWMLSPALARFFSLPRPRQALAQLGPGQADSLLLAARRTWHFFETFVTAAVNYLPPDNFQEDPGPVLAERTSPTNLGLYLLSCVTAQDFGWLAPQQLLQKIEAAITSMEAMEKHQGHFYNWYDVKTLHPLEPRFISTVDSGNLAGHLLVAREGLLDLLKAPLLPLAPCLGMKASVALAKLAAGSSTE